MAKMTTRQRNRMRDSSFAIPSERAYPIQDVTHARNALARVSQHGTPTERRKVQTAVKRKYPNIKQTK